MKEKDQLKKTYEFTYNELIQNQDEFDEFDEFDEEYYDEKSIYYQWSKKNDSLIRKGYNWENCFNKTNPIYYGIYEDDRETIYLSERFGYVKPIFEFISFDINYNTNERGEEYINALNLYGLSESGFATPSQISIISIIRDTLLKQIKRQVKLLHKINSEIESILKVYIYETTTGFRELKLGEASRENIIKHVRSVNDVINNTSFFYDCFITHPIQSSKVGLFFKDVHNNPYVSKHLIEATNYGINLFLKMRDPIFEVAVNLAKKIHPLENILEDSLFHGKLSTTKDYKKRILTRRDIVHKAHELKDNGMEVEDMFNFIKKWLFEELGFSKSELKLRFKFEIKDHVDAHNSFNKFVNINKKLLRTIRND